MLKFCTLWLLCIFGYMPAFIAEPYDYGGSARQSDVGVPEIVKKFWPQKNPNTYVKTPGSKTYYSPQNGMFSGFGDFGFTIAPKFEQTNKKGCPTPPISDNSIRSCNINTGCRITCQKDYQFPNGQTSLLMACENGEWEIKGSKWETLPHCEPICLPICQNNGICVGPGQCSCPENFSGPQCQYEKKPCLNPPPFPKNSRRTCVESSCTITCAKGYHFPDGSAITNIICKEGDWVPTRQDMVSIPDCQPTCEPPCSNGGVCLSLNVCQCPQAFRGTTCQYPISACAASKLGFNGGYNCSGNADGLSCSLSCPSGVHFDSRPLPFYTCLYSTGQFQPQPIPQCAYGKHDVMILGGSSVTYYKPKNSTFPLQGGMDHGYHPVSPEPWSSSHVQEPGSPRLKNDSSPSKTRPNMYSETNPIYNMFDTSKPKPGTCFTWGGAHYKTFDGKVYSFTSECRHVLIRDSQDNTFSVTIQNVAGGRSLTLFIQDKEYTMGPSEDGGVIFRSTKRLLPIPAQLPGLRVEMAGHMIRMDIESTGVIIKWNALQFVQVDVTESMWKRTEGLCGKIDGNPNNDMANKDGVVPKSILTLADSWQINKIGDKMCESNPSEQNSCKTTSPEINQMAKKFCSQLMTNKRFSACSGVLDISILHESCMWDYCGCVNRSREACGCDSLSVYASQCVAQGITSLANWRDENTCKMDCPPGMVYEWCGPALQKSCGSAASSFDNSLLAKKDTSCTEGCFCPVGTLFHKGKCITKAQCPCRLRGKQFPPGSSVPKDCNTCTCQNGEWICTQAICGARCSAIGDPHYQTFDGKHYNFMGQCSYTLLKGSNFSIEAENVACSGAISEAMNLPSSGNLWEMPSCTRALSIVFENSVVQLKQGRNVIINGKDVTKLPAKFRGMKISIVSSFFMKVEMPNGLEVWWDGMTRAYIDAPASFHGKTKGLCGTFNSNQKDDFLTPEGDVEQSIIPFANKWKTGEKCDDMPDKEVSHPCEVNIHNKATAQDLCGKLKTQLFEECHWSVDVEPFYEDCLYDMCSCDGPIDRCLCPILGAYATECARQGIHIQWRFNVKECEVHCPGGQTYQVCGDSCERSCFDIAGVYEDLANLADEGRCRSKCVEGCNCPNGQTLDESGECIPIGSCPCRHAGLVFPPQYKEVRPGTKQQEFCVCAGAKWECRPATKDEIKTYPRAQDVKDKCTAKNEEFTTCEPTEPVTCKSMHHPNPGSSPAECRPGCQCKKGYVFDSVAKTCVKPEDCPCHHGGKSYADGQSMQEDCNVCKCNSGKWICENRPCPGVCSSWGDSHFKTFDGRHYDFQGVCMYLLSKGSLDSHKDGYSVEIQNEVCGTSGVTCSKSVTLKVGSGSSIETVTFMKDKPLPDLQSLKRIQIRNAGLFIFADVPSLGIVLQWDKGTRVYVKANPSWKGRLKGLCGNYNENEADDFQTPSGGVAESSARLFGDSWKLRPHCPPSQEIQDTCSLHPERRMWAAQQCGILKRYPFTACHSEVPPGEFQLRCERDTCACGLGGDCECLCTALAAYAHECAARGVPIKWRTQELCPMQCDETCTNYSPCISTCPIETCDNTLNYLQLTTMCPQDTCIEGCDRKKTCSPDKVYSNNTYEECVPKASCKPICVTLPNGQVLLEGDIIEQDECHRCTCTRGKKVCRGQPCSTSLPTYSTPKYSDDGKIECKTGWTDWINTAEPEYIKNEKNLRVKSNKPYSLEIESIPTMLELNSLEGAVCDTDKMVDIECRTVKGHKSAKETGLEAECSLKNGLLCRQPKKIPCPDFEIRVKCQCEKPVDLACNATNRFSEHPTDCTKYFECTPGSTSEKKDVVGKKCAPGTMYNPKTMDCDWPANVLKIKPECEVLSTTETYPFIESYTFPTLEKIEKLPTTISPVFVKKVCDSIYHHLPHPTDCAQFYHCAPGMGPKEHPDLVLKTCGKDMFYNPKTMNCDWPQNVISFKPECRVSEVTTSHPKFTEFVLLPGKNETHKEQCPVGKTWSDCAVNCNHVCLFYDFYLVDEGICDENKDTSCIPGCIDESVFHQTCGKGFLWRDAKTCVAVHDCTCRTHTGKAVKPGEAVHESECEICQCLENEYVCDRSTCSGFSTVQPIKYVGPTEAISEAESEAPLLGAYDWMPTLTTPPPECDPNSYTNVLWDENELPLGDEAFTASSSLNNMFSPKSAKLNGKPSNTTGGSWIPKVSNTRQYIQVKLDRREPIYGVWMQGSPSYDAYVTSYNVKYSTDGDSFNYIKNPDGSPQVFRGPVDHMTPSKQMFAVPIEPKYVRIMPLTWHDEISVRLELIGCSEVTTVPSKEWTTTTEITFGESITPTFGTTEGVEMCKDSMKVADGNLPMSFIKISSYRPGSSPENINILQPKGWQPFTNSPREWVKIDFSAPRNLTGVLTKGGPSGWVTSYIVQYSLDDLNWNEVVDSNGEQKIFPANFDEKTPVTNYFQRPINARYLKITPTKWKRNIEMRVEPIGCYVPYEIILPEPVLETEVTECNICDGIKPPSEDCNCTEPFAFNGHSCQSRAHCPCVHNDIPYPVGLTYETENCLVCTCKLGGVPDCIKKSCPKCKPGLIRTTNAACDCKCSPCPDGQRICPTSEICVPLSAWCNGIEDCPDDEVDCISTTPAAAVTTTTEKSIEGWAFANSFFKEKVCPTPTCSKGYTVFIKKSNNKLEMSSKSVAADSLFARSTKKRPNSYDRHFRGGIKGGTKSALRGGVKSSFVVDKIPLPKKIINKPVEVIKEKSVECTQWVCRPPLPVLKTGGGKDRNRPTCPVPSCPKQLSVEIEDDLDEEYCPLYKCIPPPRRDSICNVTGHTFNTFDGTEYQYDTCNHILARDAEDNAWDITVQKNCTKKLCVDEILISQDEDQIRLRPDMNVEFNGYQYTVDQTRKIGFQTQTFVISRLGNTLFYISTRYGFWVIYDSTGKIKVGIAGKLFEHVDGLCGFYNGDASDDRRKPDGTQSRSTEEFGDSWAHKDTPEICKAQTCPLNLRMEVMEICKLLSKKTFSKCQSVIDEETSYARCLEEACNCLQSDAEDDKKIDKKTKSDKCLCNALQTHVTECLAADQSIDLRGWRTEMNCPVTCPNTLVHYDCFRHSCELCCDTLKEENPCPITPGVCFSGCFCPEGYVRKGDICVPPTECRDCVCDGFGLPQYVTFDRRNFTFDGKCAYTVVRDKAIDGKHNFEVFVHHDKCPHDKESICTLAVHVVYGDNILHIQKTRFGLEVLVNGMKIKHYPFTNEWLQLQKISGNDITIIIPAIQLELSSVFHNMAFNVRLPSSLYKNKVEGLCGDCDGNELNDLGKSDDPLVYAKSWRAPEPILETFDLEESSCFEKPKNECWPLPPNKDPCFNIMDEDMFGKCHPVVDPAQYLASCQQDICSVSQQTGACNSLEAYARECLRAGICLDWRKNDLCPYECKAGLEYNACGFGCQVTCDNYQKYAKKPSLCTVSRIEGCFCPEEKVLMNGTCIDHKKCFPCDSEGHYVGDTWQLDECTECTCTKRGGSTCVTKSCAQAMSCADGFEAQKIAKPPGQCCPEFICIPEPTEIPPTCEEPTKISCGFGQDMILEAKSKECPQFVCKCKPPEDCEPIDPKSQFEMIDPGMESFVNKSECCPRLTYICNAEKCPKKPKCPTFHILKQKKKGKDDCCLNYECEFPKDKCLYDVEYDSAPNGGEIKKQSNIETVRKGVGSTWQDGPCRTCICKKVSDNEVRPICSITQCPAVGTSEDFVIEHVGIPSTCCAQPKYKACKYNGKVYEIGKTWQSETNPCESFKCVLKEIDETLEKQSIVKECEEQCKEGWKYVPSPKPKEICCGKCVPYACVVNGTEHKIGEKWTSKDFCSKYQCVEKDGMLQVQSNSETCPPIDDDLKDDYEFKEIVENGKCCKKIVPIACKVNGEIYKEGSTWESPDGDPCKNITCTNDSNGKLTKLESQESCPLDCALGWEYHRSLDPHVCCGKCVQTACVVDNKKYKPDEKWFSKDKCTEFTCDNLMDQLMVTSEQESCPDISGCKDEYIYDKGCCQYCNITALSQLECAPESLPLNETVGLVVQIKPPHGKCRNKNSLHGFKQCKGTCNSGTVFNKETTTYNVDCRCCQALKYDGLIVDMTCENGHVFKKQVAIPSVCECSPCVSETISTKSGRKTVGPRQSPRASFTSEGDSDLDDVELLETMDRK